MRAFPPLPMLRQARRASVASVLAVPRADITLPYQWVASDARVAREIARPVWRKHHSKYICAAYILVFASIHYRRTLATLAEGV
jgi:hypothetical protein